MEYSDKHDMDLPNGWQSRGIPKLKELLSELKGVQPDVKADVAVSGKQPVSTTNPFGEEIINVVIPVDKQNPKIKTFWASVNCKPLLFPVGKMAKMPRSYYEVYIKSVEADMKVQQKMEEYKMKEI